MKGAYLMIVMGEIGWSQAALHLACAMSRREQADILLLKMIPARHPLLLGTRGGSLSFTESDSQALQNMAATAEDYGVSLKIEYCQYVNYWHGVVNAAEQLSVTAVLIHIPHNPIPYYRDLRSWWLRRHLARQHQLLIPLDSLTPSLTWTPSITVQDDMAALLNHHFQHR